MNVVLWVLQSLLAAIFLYSGGMKSTQPAQKLVAGGQTGVEGLSQPLLRFIGISEILGAVGLILPWLTKTMPALTPIAAIGLGLIMVLAAIVHYRRNEIRTVIFNLMILLACATVAYFRLRWP